MNSFFLLFISVSTLEIYLLIKIGGKIGALNTISLIFLTAIIGIYFAKAQGIKTMRSGLINLYKNVKEKPKLLEDFCKILLKELSQFEGIDTVIIENQPCFKNPMVSEIKPGKIRNTAAIAIDAPDTIS